MEGLRDKLLDNMENTLLEGELKMVDIKKDQLEGFLQLIRQSFSYNRQFDTDFIFADGDYQRAINLKRGRAQANYTKLYLLKKMAENKKLNEKEGDLLRDWHEHIVKGVTQLTVYERFTTLLISELPWEDLQSLRLKSSDLKSNKDMPVIDLLMELNLFLNDSLIDNYELQVKAENLAEKYHIPLFMFQQTATAGSTQLENQVEAAILAQHSQLTPADIVALEELFKIFKTEGFRERNRYAALCGKFKENLGEMNQFVARSELIQEYVRVMEEEFMKEYDPRLVQEIKEKETDKLWREIFHHPYDNCTKEQLRDITRKLMLRMELFNQKTPPFFGSLVLSLLMHPNLDALTKEVVLPLPRASSPPPNCTTSISN